MTEEQKQQLDAKRTHLQTTLRVKQTAKRLLQAWQDYFAWFKELGLPYRVVYLDSIAPAELPYWQEELQKEPWTSLGLNANHLLVEDKYPAQEQTFCRFPDTHPLRYVPNLPLKAAYEENAGAMVAKAVAELGLPNQKVYFFLPRFSIVIETDLSAIEPFVRELSINAPDEDIVVVALDYRWMIFRSLELEWRYGFAGANQES